MTLAKVPKASDLLAAGSTRTLGPLDNLKTIRLDTLTGSVVTLPAATGSKRKYGFYVSVLATSNSHIVKCPSGSTFKGILLGTRVDSGNAVLGFAAAAGNNTITLNRTTTGSVSIGEWLECEDVASGTWLVTGVLSATGAAFATPFSTV